MTATAALGPVMTVDEAAAALRVDRSVIYKDIKAGRIEVLRIGPRRGGIRIEQQAFREYVASLKRPLAPTAQAA